MLKYNNFLAYCVFVYIMQPDCVIITVRLLFHCVYQKRVAGTTRQKKSSNQYMHVHSNK